MKRTLLTFAVGSLCSLGASAVCMGDSIVDLPDLVITAKGFNIDVSSYKSAPGQNFLEFMQYKRQVSKFIKLATLAEDVDEELLEKINSAKKMQKVAEAEISDREAKIDLLQKRLDTPEEITEIIDESEKFEYLHKVVEGIFIYGERRHKIMAIQYLNGITAYCIKATTFGDWYWFFDKGDLVITDAVALQKNSPVDLKLKDSILIEVTDSNNAYYSGEDTDKEIFGQYTTEGFYAAMMRNKQLNPVIETK